MLDAARRTTAAPGGEGAPRVLIENSHEWQSRANELHDRLLAHGDGAAALACAARALERLHRDLGAPPAIDRWIDAFDADLALAKATPGREVPHEVFRAGLAVLARRPGHPALPLWHARALAFVRAAGADADEVLRAATFSFEYALRGGSFALAAEIVQLARLRCEEASATVRTDWLAAEALLGWLFAEHERARHAIEQALALADSYVVWEQAASCAISEGDVARADVCLAAMSRTIDDRRTQDVAHAMFLSAARFYLANDTAAASQRLEACVAQDSTNIPAYFTTLWQLGVAHVDIARGRHRRAAAALAIVLGRAGTHYWQFLQFSALISRTWLRVRQRRFEQAAGDLRDGLAFARAEGYRNCDPWWDPQAMDEIARFARDVPHDAVALSALTARV